MLQESFTIGNFLVEFVPIYGERFQYARVHNINYILDDSRMYVDAKCDISGIKYYYSVDQELSLICTAIDSWINSHFKDEFSLMGYLRSLFPDLDVANVHYEELRSKLIKELNAR